MTIEQLRETKTELEAGLQQAIEQMNAWQANVCRAEGAIAIIDRLIAKESAPEKLPEGPIVNDQGDQNVEKNINS